MTDVCYRLSFTVQAPVLSHALGALGFGYDKAMLRDQAGYVLPGSLIRGNLRHALERFAAILHSEERQKEADGLQSDIIRWFGPRSAKDQAMERATLHFDYYWRARSASPTEAVPRYRIKISEDSGTVEPGQLLSIESPYQSGEELVFGGCIRLSRLHDGEEAKRLRRWLGKAADFIPALGALKGVGFGKVAKAEWAELENEGRTHRPSAQNIAPQGRLRLRLALDRPFCIAKPHAPDGNIFHGEESIPGGAIKGALARGLDDGEKNALDFDRLVFTHARPSKMDSLARERAIPWSLCWAGGRVADLALLAAQNALGGGKEDAFLLSTGQGLEAPKFPMDWKDNEWQAARQACGIRAEPGRHLAVHTAIDPETGGSAEGLLFSLDCVDPEGHDWLAEVDAGALEENTRAAALEKLAEALSRPLWGIGKTKAKAELEILAILPDARPPEPKAIKLAVGGIEHSLYIVTLQTPARLLDTVEGVAPTGGAPRLQALYRDYWRKVSGGRLDLLAYFARQTRVGGDFLHQYYWLKNQGIKAYQPWWLSDPGSVFVLRWASAGTPAEAETLLSAWQRFGLPQPEGGDSHGQWRWNPYIRENGYGEILVNDSLHTDDKIQAKRGNQEGQWQCL